MFSPSILWRRWCWQRKRSRGWSQRRRSQIMMRPSWRRIKEGGLTVQENWIDQWNPHPHSGTRPSLFIIYLSNVKSLTHTTSIVVALIPSNKLPPPTHTHTHRVHGIGMSDCNEKYHVFQTLTISSHNTTYASHRGLDSKVDDGSFFGFEGIKERKGVWVYGIVCSEDKDPSSEKTLIYRMIFS